VEMAVNLWGVQKQDNPWQSWKIINFWKKTLHYGSNCTSAIMVCLD